MRDGEVAQKLEAHGFGAALWLGLTGRKEGLCWEE